jgi:short-subunit dehydrogenase
LAAAKLLAGRGARLALVARSRERLVDLARELDGSMALPADLSRAEEAAGIVAAARRYFGRIDILVNNAGRGYDAPIERTEVDLVRSIFDLDFLASLLTMKAVIPIMREQGGGVIVNVSSGTALRHLPNMGAYSSIKGALASLSLTAREELKNDNIRVSVFYPYMTLTEFEDHTIKDPSLEEGVQAEGGYRPPPPDPVDLAAAKVPEAVEGEAAEVFAHDWMKP